MLTVAATIRWRISLRSYNLTRVSEERKFGWQELEERVTVGGEKRTTHYVILCNYTPQRYGGISWRYILEVPRGCVGKIGHRVCFCCE